jgi:hypothetical protein
MGIFSLMIHWQMSLTPRDAVFQGSGGQSFGCFIVNGINIKLVGEANDYVGKGMAGGQIVIVPPPASPFKAEDASIVGNTCLYGATGGSVFINGRAGAPLCCPTIFLTVMFSGAESRQTWLCIIPATKHFLYSLGFSRGLAAGLLHWQVWRGLVLVQVACHLSE